MAPSTNRRHPRKDTKAADHHYFPKVLQRFWRNAQGWVHRLSADGSFSASTKGSFGHIRNAHHIKLASSPSPWDESFEYTFSAADNSFPQVIDLLGTIESEHGNYDAPWQERFTPQWHLQDHRAKIAECVASLVVRSPCVRNSIRVMVESFWDGEGPWPDGKAPSSLIAMNQRHMLETYANALSQRGKFVILLSDSTEFIFGDGMLHNFMSGGPPSPYNPRCLTPVLPSLAVAYDCPSQYSRSADFVSVRLSKKEVDQVNQCTLVYSGNHIYFREDIPSELREFKLGQHRVFRYNKEPLFDEIMSAAAQVWFSR